MFVGILGVLTISLGKVFVYERIHRITTTKQVGRCWVFVSSCECYSCWASLPLNRDRKQGNLTEIRGAFACNLRLNHDRDTRNLLVARIVVRFSIGIKFLTGVREQ